MQYFDNIVGIHMKLFMNKNEKYEEPEVHMFFHKQTKEVEQVEKFVSTLSITIPAKYEDEFYKQCWTKSS